MNNKIFYNDLPPLKDIPQSVKDISNDRKISNLLLSFIDFHITEDQFQVHRKNDFRNINLLETVQDLFSYGYPVDLPHTAHEYREKIYPLIIDMHANAGYWGVQLPVGGVESDNNGIITDYGSDLLKQQKIIIEHAGLNISAVGGLWAHEWKQCIKPHIQAANILGSKYLYGPFSTPFLYFPDEYSSGNASVEWTKKRIAKFSYQLQKEIGPYAAEFGVILCEEPLQRFERMPIRLKEATELALNANIENFKIMVDMCHEFADGEGPEKFKSYLKRLHEADKLHGIHVSAIHRGKLYESWFNQEYFNDFFSPFFEYGYEGEISIETFDAMEPVVEAAKINRKMFEHPIGVMINQLVYTADKLSKVPVAVEA